MIIMGRWIKSILLFIVVSILITPVYSHPGRTDSRGGHYNKRTGEYHYHHGYSEHQHYDMDGDGVPDCPYTDKATKSASSSSSSVTVPSKQVVPVETTQTVTKSATNAPTISAKVNTGSGIGGIKVPFILLLAIIAFFLISANMTENDSLRTKVRGVEAKLAKSQMEASDNELKLQESQKVISKLQSEIDQKNNQLSNMSGEVSKLTTGMAKQNLTIEDSKMKMRSLEIRLNAADSKNANLSKENTELKSLIAKIGALVGNDTVEEAKSKPEVVIPIGVTLHNGIPIKGCPTNEKPFGDYTVYVSSKSYIYHANPNCSCSWKTPKHLYSLSSNYRKCLRCYPPDLPAAEDMEWYRDIVSAMKKLDK